MKRVAFVVLGVASFWMGCNGGGSGSSPSPDLTPLVTSTGGGLALSCAPKDGAPVGETAPDFPACTFVEQTACKLDTDCGCGCACDCGVCNCNLAAAPSTCDKPEDCGPSCLGLTCTSGQCVAAKSSDWTGTYQGTFSWPTTIYSATCGSGVSTPAATGTAGGRFSVQVIAKGDDVEVLLLSEQGSSQPLCALPFIASSSTQATLVPGSACVTAGLPSQCMADPTSPVALQTFLGGSVTLSGDTLTLTASDVFATPTESGPECDTVPKGTTQVNHESLTATLTRCAASGCPEST